MPPSRSSRQVWIALRASLRGVLEVTTLADIARGELPPAVAELARTPEAWTTRRAGHR